MKREETPDLIELLVLWYRVQQAGALAQLGYPNECPSTKGWRASRQYDDGNSAAETDARGELAKAVGVIVDGMPEPHRTALYVLARNRATQVSVWTSPRLPEDEDARAAVVAEALSMFAEKV